MQIIRGCSIFANVILTFTKLIIGFNPVNNKYTSKMEQVKRKGFKKGYGQVQQKDIPAIRKELMRALGVNNRMSLNNYMRGETEPKVSQAKEVEKVFEKYSITEVWGE